MPHVTDRHELLGWRGMIGGGNRMESSFTSGLLSHLNCLSVCFLPILQGSLLSPIALTLSDC